MGLFDRKTCSTALLFGLLWILTACGTPAYRVHPDLNTYTKKIKTVGLAPPDIKIYALTAGGVQELRDDWSREGRESVQKAVIRHFKGEKVSVAQVKIDQRTEKEMEEVLALFMAVSDSIIVHTYYPEYTFPEKKERFEYSVGPIDRILDPFGANALIVVQGQDEISSGGRKFLTAITSPLSMITGIKPRSGITRMNMALVDRSGRILWYNIGGNEGGYDLRNGSSAERFVESILDGFPEVKK